MCVCVCVNASMRMCTLAYTYVSRVNVFGTKSMGQVRETVRDNEKQQQPKTPLFHNQSLPTREKMHTPSRKEHQTEGKEKS